MKTIQKLRFIRVISGLGFISFRHSPPCGMRSLFLRGQRKEIIKNTLCGLCALSEAPHWAGQAGGARLDKYKSILCTHW